MMPLEEQVTCLDHSKRLCELGVPQKSAFVWMTNEGNRLCLRSDTEMRSHTMESSFGKENVHILSYAIPAFTVAELLPYFNEHEIYRERPVWLDKRKTIRWMRMDWSALDHRIWQADTDANALGGLLIHLIEQGLIKQKELK